MELGVWKTLVNKNNYKADQEFSILLKSLKL